MQPRLSRPRKGWAVLAAGAVVASLLAAGATTATAVTDTPDEKSNVTACVGEALTDWGFTDVSDNHVFHDSINCLAHYGITIGCGDGTTFCPEEPIQRWQMMLFLARALEPAGINLSRARPQNFTDLGILNDEARDAIDLMVTNRIADPAGPRIFDPNGIVNRTEMAQLLVRLLDAAGPVVDIDSDGDFLLDANRDGIRSRPDDYFEDASNQVSRLEDAAISAAYELGITTGVSATPTSGTAQPGLDLYYEPFGDVTRGQMAAFIIRTLGHTMARPRGLSAQYDGNEIRVSLRNDDFEPVDRAPVDMFYIETDDADRAFTSRGTCSSDVESVDGTFVCEIDSSDLATDNDGEVSLNVPQTIIDGTDTTVWVWTGREGDRVGRRTDLVRLDIAPSEQPQGATTAEISTTFRGSKARFGVTVTFTVQLQDSNGNDVSVGLDGRRPAEWTLTEELLQDAIVDGDPDSTSAVKFRNTRTVRSDSGGQVRFSVSEQRPSLCTASSCTRTFKLTELSNAPAVAVNSDLVRRSLGRSDGDVYYLEFSSAAPTLTNSVVRLTVPNPYINVPDRGTVNNTVVVTVHNEYGEALSAATASLASDRQTNLTTQRFTIGGDGLHRFNYRYDGFGAEVETLTVTVDPDGSGSAPELDSMTALVYWPLLTYEATTNEDRYYILFGDTSRNELIVDLGANTYRAADAQPERVVYDSSHRFDVQGANDDAPVAVNSIEDFEKALAAYLADSPETTACLEWSGYDPDRLHRVATFRLWRIC